MAVKNKLILGYIAIAVITFGVAAASWSVSPCAESSVKSMCEVSAKNSNAIHGFVAGAVWPLYWSWGFFDFVIN